MAEETVVAPPSISESLSTAVERVERGEGVQSTPADAPLPTETAPATETPTARAARERDAATGRFARRSGEAAGTPDTPPPAATPTEAVAPPAEAAAPPDDAPSGWKDTAKGKWASLDAEVKAEIQRREREINVGLQRAAETKKFGDSIMQEMAPYMDILRAEGATPQSTIRTLLEGVHILRYGSPEHKKAMMLGLIQQYGVDFSQSVNPALAQTEAELDARRREEMRSKSQQSTQMMSAAEREIEDFAAQPGHEHLESLRGHMIALLQNGTAASLQDAYEQAAWAHPKIRPVMQQAADLARQQSFSKNRNAAASVTGAPGAVSVAPATDPTKLRDLIEAQFSAHRI